MQGARFLGQCAEFLCAASSQLFAENNAKMKSKNLTSLRGQMIAYYLEASTAKVASKRFISSVLSAMGDEIRRLAERLTAYDAFVRLFA